MLSRGNESGGSADGNPIIGALSNTRDNHTWKRLQSFRLSAHSGTRVLRPKGFTIFDMVMAVVIVGLLAAVALPAYTGAVDKARAMTAIGDMHRIEGAIERFVGNNNGNLPANLAELGMAGLNDPWKSPYQYLNIETAKNRGAVRKDRNLVPINTDYDLYSMGKDGASRSPLTAKASRDDIIRAGNGGFIGSAEDF
jgi:general secretion pathway protein G